MLDRIDRGLDQGRIDATLPDGSFRMLGGRGAGPVGDRPPAGAGARWSGSSPRARSAGTRPGRWANGRAPIRCRCSTCSCATPRRSATPPAPRGRGGWSTGSPIACAPTIARRRAAQHRPPLRPRQRFLRRLARSRHDLFERGLRRADRGRRAAGGGAGAQGPAAARPARPEARPASARDRLRLGRRSPRSPRAIMASRSPASPCRPSRRPMPSAARPGRPRRPGRRSQLTDYRDVDGRVRRRRQRRDGRGGRPGILAGLSREHRPRC